ncbi:MAG: hypothetical protein R6U66_06350 [Bacteroidales bacterium]
MQGSPLSDIYLFHAACEMAVANGTNSFQANRRIRQFEQDLQCLPAYLMNATDILLVEKAYVERCRSFFGHLYAPSQFVTQEEAIEKAREGELNFGTLRPWGWSPVLHKQMKSLKPYLSQWFNQSVVGQWELGYKPFFSRLFALNVLTDLIAKQPLSYYIDSSLLPVPCLSVKEVKKQLRKHNKLVLKAPYSASGRGVQVVAADVWRSFHDQWAGGVIRRQGMVMVEPHLNRKSDVGFQFRITDQGHVEYLGLTFFKTDETGQYLGNYLGLLHRPMEILRKVGFSLTQLHNIAKNIKSLLKASEVVQYHRGYLGVDALVFTDEHGGLRINPVLEINLRSTMGTVAMALESRYLSNGQTGFMGIQFSSTDSFASFLKEHQQQSGFRLLTPIAKKTQFGAWMQVNEL